MRNAIAAMAAGVVLAGGFSSPTLAQGTDCKKDALVQAGDPSVSRSLGAFPSSFFAWKKAARDKYGADFDNWSAANDRRIDCKQTDIAGTGRRWVCTRTAKPCKGGLISLPDVTQASISKKLVRGDKGPEVETLQKLLQTAGFYNGANDKIDGNFGRGTENAVKKFQKAAGIGVDGRVGKDTVTALGAKWTGA